MRRYLLVLVVLVGCAGQTPATSVPPEVAPSSEVSEATITPSPWTPPPADQPTSTAVVLPPTLEELATPEEAVDLPILPMPVGDDLVSVLGELQATLALIQTANGELVLIDPQTRTTAAPWNDLVALEYCDEQAASSASGAWSGDGRFLALQCSRPDGRFGLAVLDLPSATWLSLESAVNVFMGGWQGDELLLQVEQPTGGANEAYSYVIWNPTTSAWRAFPPGFPTNLAPQWSPTGAQIAALRLEPESSTALVWNRADATLQRFELQSAATYTPALWWFDEQTLLLVQISETANGAQGEYVQLDLASGALQPLAAVHQDTISHPPLYRQNPNGSAYLLSTNAGWQVFEQDGTPLELQLPPKTGISDPLTWTADGQALIMVDANELRRYGLDGSVETITTLPAATILSLQSDLDGTLALGLSKPEVLFLNPDGQALNRIDGRILGWRP